MNVWRRFRELSVRAKAGIVGGAAAVLVLVAVVLVSARGGDEPAAELLTGEPSPTAASAVLGDSTAAPRDRLATPARAPDRNDCDSIRGTSYRSPAERAWYLANCVAAAGDDAEQAQAPIDPGVPPLPQAKERSPPEEPAPTPTPLPTAPRSSGPPEPVLLRSEAIGLAIDWLMAQGLSAGEFCSAEWIESITTWKVTCVLPVMPTAWRYVCVEEPSLVVYLAEVVGKGAVCGR